MFLRVKDPRPVETFKMFLRVRRGAKCFYGSRIRVDSGDVETSGVRFQTRRNITLRGLTPGGGRLYRCGATTKSWTRGNIKMFPRVKRFHGYRVSTGQRFGTRGNILSHQVPVETFFIFGKQ